MKQERTLLFWSPRTRHMIPKSMWESDRVIEVPDDIKSDAISQVAQRLTALLKEEIIASKETEQKMLRIIQMGPSVVQGVLEHVLTTVLSASGGGLNVLRLRPKDQDAPLVVLDSDTADQLISSVGKIDFSKPPLEDKRLFNDDLPPSLESPHNNKKT